VVYHLVISTTTHPVQHPPQDILSEPIPVLHPFVGRQPGLALAVCLQNPRLVKTDTLATEIGVPFLFPVPIMSAILSTLASLPAK
jgi:hypothetical protein